MAPMGNRDIEKWKENEENGKIRKNNENNEKTWKLTN